MNQIARLETSDKASFELLNQIEERQFDDVRQYRLYQLALLESKNGSAEHHDIDFILNEDATYKTSDDLHLLDDEEWKNDQLYRTSEKIVEELETYQIILKMLQPEETAEAEKPIEQKEHHEKSFNGKSVYSESYETLKRNFKLIYNGFSKLSDQSDMEYVEPFEQLDDYSVI